MHKLTTLIVALVGALLSAAPARANLSPAERARLDAAAHAVDGMHETIPGDYWNRAHCVVVIPELKKAALVIGDRKSTRLNSSHIPLSRMPSSA